MSRIDSKLEILAQSARFRIESGTVVLTADMLADASPGYFIYEIPCSEGVKFFAFHADNDTRAKITATSGTQFVISVFGNYFVPDVVDASNAQTGFGQTMQNFVYEGKDYGWMARPATFKRVVPSQGNGVAFRAPALKAGTYRWTAYYWNE